MNARRLSLAVTLILFAACPARAQTPPPTCGPDIYTAFKQKATLEATRESEIAQRLILKADSVLEYSCFKENVTKNWYENAGRFFSEAQLGSDIPLNSLDMALQTPVVAALDTYLQSNFGHEYLGGSIYSAESGSPGTSGACDAMNWVWQVAKCVNANVFHFFRISKLHQNDYRSYPYSCAAVAQDYVRRRNNAVQTAHDGLKDYLQPEHWDGVDNATKLSKTENMTYTQRLLNCGKPVSVGRLAQFRQDGGTFKSVMDHACITPGCSYQPSGNGAGEGQGQCTRGGLTPF